MDALVIFGIFAGKCKPDGSTVVSESDASPTVKWDFIC